MKLIPNAGAVLKRAWSSWAFYALIAIGILEPTLQQLTPEALHISPAVYSIAVTVIAAIGAVARALPQAGLTEAPKGGPDDPAP